MEALYGRLMCELKYMAIGICELYLVSYHVALCWDSLYNICFYWYVENEDPAQKITIEIIKQTIYELSKFGKEYNSMHPFSIIRFLEF